MTIVVHVFPIPHGMTAEEAQMEADVLGKFHGYRRWKPKFWFMKWTYTVTEVPDDD